MIGPIILVKYISVSDLYASQGETVADLFLSKSAVNNCKDPILFRKEMAQLVRDARQNLASISKVTFLLTNYFSYKKEATC